MRVSLSILAALACAGCSLQGVVDGTADLTFQLGSPAQVVHERRPEIVGYESDEGGGTVVTLVDDAGSDTCSFFAPTRGMDFDPMTVCTLATPVGRVAVTLTLARLPSDQAKSLTLEGTLAGGAGSMTLSFSGTPR